MENLQQTAEYFHSLGANVLPNRGKAPIVDWTHLQTEKQSLETLRSYNWNNSSGIGIVNGPGGYVTIDIDKITKPEMVNTILVALNLTPEYVWQVKSGSGKGYHIWILVNEMLPFEKGVIWGLSKDGSFEHMEIRWKECQTIIPPSIHKSGNSYEWVHGVPVGVPMQVSVGQILSMFEQIATLRLDDPKKDKPMYEKTEYSALVANGVDEGRRNDSLASIVGHLRSMGMNFSEAVEWCKLWNKNLVNPMDNKEVDSTLESIYSYPSDDMTIRTGAEMLLMDAPVMNDIVDGIIGERSFNFLAGEEGSGKSLLAMNLGLAVATGMKKFLHYDVKKHGKVLYLNNELSFYVFLNRFKRMKNALKPGELKLVDNFLTPEITKPLAESWDDIVKTILKHNPTLLILDCLYWAHDKKENDATEMKSIMRQLVSLRDKYGVATIIVHHTKKGTRYETMHNDNMRGSQVFSASADTNLAIRRDAHDPFQRIIKPTKLRNGSDEHQKTHLLQLNGITLWFEDKGEVVEEEHIATPGGTNIKTDKTIDWKVIFGGDTILKRAEIVERFKGVGITQERTVDRRLETAYDNGILNKPKSGTYEIAKNGSLPLETNSNDLTHEK